MINCLIDYYNNNSNVNNKNVDSINNTKGVRKIFFFENLTYSFLVSSILKVMVESVEFSCSFDFSRNYI